MIEANVSGSLLATIVIWLFTGYGFENGSFGAVEDMDHSLLAYIGKGIGWLFIPLGWGHWQAAVAAINGLVAKEVVVGTFGILYGFAEVAEDGKEIWGKLAADFTVAWMAAANRPMNPEKRWA